MDSAIEYVRAYASNFWRNLTGIFDDMSNTRWIRLVAVVGAYLLLRPYLVKLGEKLSNKQDEQTTATTQTATGPKAKISPNALRGLGGEEEEEEQEEKEVGEAKGVDAGKTGKARKRQQKKATQGQEEKDSNAELLDQLVDYEEGQDGW